MKTVEEMLLEFQTKYGHLIMTTPTSHIPEVVKQLRMKLIEEEQTELFKAIEDNDLVEIADGIADLVYVVVGTAISYGIPFDRIFREVHNSNMTKTAVKATEGAKYGTKTPKGPDFLPPNIWRILFEPGVKTELEQ